MTISESHDPICSVSLIANVVFFRHLEDVLMSRDRTFVDAVAEVTAPTEQDAVSNNGNGTSLSPILMMLFAFRWQST
jgi:hypothetical protein